MNDKELLEKMTFEDAMDELEGIVNALDKGDVSLDEAIAAYDRGSVLKDHCEKRLNQAKMKVETIQSEENGELKTDKVDVFKS
ncbi:exodeoxyribonuclease VII small subunit [Alphaproteobacteria bacterium]|jgi:exodeoxyribonuclease VII small subunit|nr:exodeoxyribonuclease VII small subunit [Alphaproteobacteria bacterium]|tara:strand:- start:1686 stop:1934 length:249 start_codon:yes stop_codon:yes gene_type:complete